MQPLERRAGSPTAPAVTVAGWRSRKKEAGRFGVAAPPPQPEEGKGGAIDWPCMVSPQSYECNVPVRAVDVVNRELAQSKQQFPSK